MRSLAKGIRPRGTCTVIRPRRGGQARCGRPRGHRRSRRATRAKGGQLVEQFLAVPAADELDRPVLGRRRHGVGATQPFSPVEVALQSAREICEVRRARTPDLEGRGKPLETRLQPKCRAARAPSRLNKLEQPATKVWARGVTCPRMRKRRSRGRQASCASHYGSSSTVTLGDFCSITKGENASGACFFRSPLR
jgi:hypothetical protein